MARLWRVYHAELPAAAGARVDLADEEAHHVARVLRLRPGDPLSLFDGDGHEWRATLVTCDPGRVGVRLDAPIETPVEAPLHITLVQGLCRPDRMEWLIQKATEIGVATIIPMRTERSERLRLNAGRLDRWRRIAVEACKQSGRRRCPLIEEREELPPPGPGERGWLLDTGETTPPLATFLEARPVARVLLAVGPEAGFSPEERGRWTELGWRRAGLGPRILRTETAGLAAATILLHRWGDLGSSPSAHREGFDSPDLGS